MMNHIKSRDIFIYTITPRFITGCILSKKEGSTSFTLHTYHKKIVDYLALEHLYIFNPTYVRTILLSWYPKSNHKLPVACGLLGPSLHEEITPFATMTPLAMDDPYTNPLHMHREYSYLYSYENLHYFYRCAIEQTILFQYKLLSITARLPFHIITTQNIALLSVYRALFGATYRSAQLALALTRCNNSIEDLFSSDDLARLLSIPSSITLSDEDIRPLLVSCGLFLMKEQLS